MTAQTSWRRAEVRIIGGQAGGRRLVVPPAGTRPTTDRVREALFSSLDALLGDWSGLRILDAYAGSGAVGLEALSRGARSATFVERDRRTAALLRRNIETVGLPGASVIVADAQQADLPGPYDLVFLDPPYAAADEEVAGLLDRLAAMGAVPPEGFAVVERDVRSGAPWPREGWDALRRRDYGETSLWYGQFAS